MVLTTFLTVLKMLLFAFPAYLLMKAGKVKAEVLPSMAALLLYVLQSALMIYAFLVVDFSPELLRKILLCGLITLLCMVALLGCGFLLCGKRWTEVRHRIANVAICFGNIGFMGIPVMAAVMPDCPEIYVYSAAFSFSMNLLGWTVGSAIITRDKKYISLRKALLNPMTISIAVALPLYVLQIRLPAPVFGAIESLQAMCTPMCMIMMGFRLATTDLRKLVTTGLYYGASAVKLIVMPVLILLVLRLIPMDVEMRTAIFVMSACPVAAVVQNFAELIGCGQEDAANMMLLSSFLSVATIPLLAGLFC